MAKFYERQRVEFTILLHEGKCLKLLNRHNRNQYVVRGEGRVANRRARKDGFIAIDVDSIRIIGPVGPRGVWGKAKLEAPEDAVHEYGYWEREKWAKRAKGVAFEQQCCEELNRAGWIAETTAYRGDRGADVIAKMNGLTVALQCKAWAKNVGPSAVEEIHSARTLYSADHAVVVSISGFTRQAEQVARSHVVHLIQLASAEELPARLSDRFRLKLARGQPISN